MEMRKFGKTNMETSAVVFGGGFVGGIIINADDVNILQSCPTCNIFLYKETENN